MNKKNKRNVIYIIVAIFVVFAFAGCPTEENNNQSNRGLLTIAELPLLPFGVSYTVYVFPNNANMSWGAVNSAITSGNFAARGIIQTGTTNIFALSGWNGVDFIDWEGAGNFNVILANSGGDKYDETNPMYRFAVISFINGEGNETFNNFMPIVGPLSSSLTIDGLPPLVIGFSYVVYIFRTDINLAVWEDVYNAINDNRHNARGLIKQGTTNVFALTTWDGFSFVEWEGSGNYIVILVDSSGDMFSAISPMHRTAMVNFTDGTGAVALSLFSSIARSRPIRLFENNVEINLWTPNEPGTINDIFDWLGNNAQSNRTYRIQLSEDVDSTTIRINSTTLNGATNSTVIFEGTEKERLIRHVGSGALLLIGQGGRVILNNNITLDGSIRVRSRSPLVVVTNGYFEMNDGSRIQNNGTMHIDCTGGGVFVNVGLVGSPTSIFVMNGGVISNNQGNPTGGVRVDKRGGIFRKYGGIITGWYPDNRYGNRRINTGGGHAVRLEQLPPIPPSSLRRSISLNNTVGENHNLNSAIEGAAGGWVE